MWLRNLLVCALALCGILRQLSAFAVAEANLYCVIDLSGGPTAASYPVSYMDAVPSSGWTDQYKTSKLVLRRIDPGTFMMGSPSNEIGRSSYEVLHQVILTRPFYLGVFEVSQRQWELVLGTRPSRFSNDSYYASRPVEQVSYHDIRGAFEGKKWPSSSAVDSDSFLGVLRSKTRLQSIDLPTEAQWEYACRAGTPTAFNNGKNLSHCDGDAPMYDVGRYWDNGGYSSVLGKMNADKTVGTSCATAAIGTYLPNSWGLYDMHGNVEEWCLDWWMPSLESDSDPVGGGPCSNRSLRGGSWGDYDEECRSASRGYPGDNYGNSRSSSSGFRISLVLDSTEHSFVVSYDANGGDCAVIAQCINNGRTLSSLPVPKRIGCSFVGWFTEAIGGLPVTENSTVSSDATLFAHWSGACVPPTGFCVLTFDANGGSGSTSCDIKYGKAVCTLPVVTREGYSFLGWYTKVEGGDAVFAETVVTSSMTLYAHWKQVYVPPKRECTVKFEANGGVVSSPYYYIVEGKSVGTLPVPTRDGYTFVGWFTTSDGGDAITSATVITSSITFYAHWTADSKPTQDFDSASDSKKTEDYDEQISEWASSLSSHGDPTAVWVQDETVYLDEIELPYTYQCGAILHKTKGGYRLDLPGIDITDLCIQANGDLAVLVTGENFIRVNSNRGDFNVERMPGMFYSGIYAHNLFVFGPGQLTVVGAVDSQVWGTSGILAEGNLKIAAGTTVTLQNVKTGISCRSLDIVLAKLRLSGIEGNGIDATSVLLNSSCVAGTCSGDGVYSSGFLHVYQSLVDLQCTGNCFASGGDTKVFESYVTLLSWEQGGIMSYGNVVMEDSAFSAYAGPKYCGVCASQTLGIGEGRYTIATGEEGAGVRGSYVVLAGGDIEVCAPKGIGCLLYTEPYCAASNLVYSGSFKTSDKIDIKELLTINLESAAIYGVSSALLSSGLSEFMEDVGGKLLMAGVNTLATSFKHGRPKYGIQTPYDSYLGAWISDSRNSYVEIDGGTVLIDNAEVGVQVPICYVMGGSFNGSYSLYNGIKPIAAWIENKSLVYKNLKCVEEQFSAGKEGDKITAGWKTKLPSYYGTRSLYLDENRKLYFWIPEDSQGGDTDVNVIVSFDANGGSVSESRRSCTKEKAIGTLPTPTWAKHKFDGWYTAATGGTKVTDKTKVTADVTYYAHWTYDGKITISAALGEGCVGMGSVSGGGTVATGKSATVKATTRSAKKATKTTVAQTATVFAGWYLDVACKTKASGTWQSPSYTTVAGENDVTLYAKFIEQADDVATVSFELPDELTTGSTAVNAAVDVSGCSSLPTVKVSGLPTGLKFTAKALDVKATKATAAAHYDANTIYGTPTKSGVYTVVATVTTAGKKTASFSQTVVVRKVGENVVKVDVPTIGEVVPGKVTGSGVYAVGKKVSLRATANKGFVFAGWQKFGEDAVLSKSANYAIDKMPNEDVILAAKFITSAEDKVNITANVNGMDFDAGGDGKTIALTTNIWSGVYLEWSVAASALSEASVKVMGLPSGLKFAAKDVTQKIGSGKTAQTVVVVPANTIYGAPSAASKTTTDRKTGKTTVTPSAVKITVTTVGKSSQTYQIDTTVDPLPAWAQGTFTGPSYDGDATNGLATVTIASSGKISAKQPVNGKTTSFAASYFDSYVADEPGFHATLTAKVGKEVVTNELAISPAEIAVSEMATVTNGIIVAEIFDAWQYNWKVEPWKSIGKSVDKQTLTYVIKADGSFSESDDDLLKALGAEITARVTLKFAASGKVTIAGEFVTGYDAKKAKFKTTKTTGSTIMVPNGDNQGLVFIYLTPKGVPSHTRCVMIPLAEE